MLAPVGRARMLGGSVLLLTLAAGGLAGAAVERVLNEREPVTQVVEPRGRGNGEIDCERYRQRRRGPFGSLGLTQEQESQIDHIFDVQRRRMDEFWAEAGPRMNRILDETRTQGRAILNPEQQTEYDRNRERRRDRAAEREKQDSIRRAEIRARCGDASIPPSGSGPGRRP